MVKLPVWELGLVILGPMVLVLALRGWLERRYVMSRPPMVQSLAQFKLEMGLYFAAGMGMALILLLRYHFPLLQSGMKLVVGIFTVGVFAGLDLALARERQVIHDALTGRASYEPPRDLVPLTRKFTQVAVLTLLLITAIIIMVIIRDVYWLAEQDLTLASVKMLGYSVLVEISFVMGLLLLMVLNLVFSYARNLRLLFDNETGVLERVSRGDLSKSVPVTTNDEMGVIAGHTNIMIKALREGVRMREGLQIAQEVQQHFLPKAPPVADGLDLAGTAHFSDETGGDFYDFIDCGDEDCRELAVVVGDVSGHGIGAALLMATGRALIRQASGAGSPAGIISAVNDNLSRDMADTGRFLTLFYLLLDLEKRTASWVNAGHQPPLVFDPATDTFTELKGGDIPLGVEREWVYHEQSMPMPGPGQVVLIGTDGAWEAHNEAGEMFGNDRLREVVRQSAGGTAEEILQAVVSAVAAFTGGIAQEDDLTLVVLKGVPQN